MRSDEFAPENFEKVELEFDKNKATLFQLTFWAATMLVFLTLFFLIQSITPAELFAILRPSSPLSAVLRLGIVLVIAAVGIVVHELLHAVFYLPYTKNGFKSLKIGFKLSHAYCECTEIMRTNQAIVSLMAPLIILGIIPAIVAVIIGNAYLLIFGIFFTVAGSADTQIFLSIFKNRKITWFEDKASILKFYVHKPIQNN
ncbi:MAG: DUF3267 domain-containing protein [Oscillospiraceae bacterium]|nr:DUF3267 domain-containing protein [Oscillospiraceae bacterium]